MPKVENSYKPRLKTLLKQYRFNVNRAQILMYTNLISVHMDRFAYMQNLHICKLNFALGLNQVQISRRCKFCIRVQIHSHGQNICIFARVCKSVHVKAHLFYVVINTKARFSAAMLAPSVKHLSHVIRKPNIKGADQPAQPRSLISAFVVRCLDSIILLLATAEISRLQLASDDEQPGLSLIWSETPKIGFLITWLISYSACS